MQTIQTLHAQLPMVKQPFLILLLHQSYASFHWPLFKPTLEAHSQSTHQADQNFFCHLAVFKKKLWVLKNPSIHGHYFHMGCPFPRPANLDDAAQPANILRPVIVPGSIAYLSAKSSTNQMCAMHL